MNGPVQKERIPMIEMKEKTWTFMDRSGWGIGPWDGEPDKVEWRDVATGLPCIARRSPVSGAWCGYVAVTEDHPLFGQEYDDVEESVEVHGGLTFASACQEGEGEHAICHAPLPGESDRVWWFGFDCMHLYDAAPGSRYGGGIPGLGGSMLESMFDLADGACAAPLPSSAESDAYRTLGYVRKECAGLAGQLSALS